MLSIQLLYGVGHADPDSPEVSSSQPQVQRSPHSGFREYDVSEYYVLTTTMNHTCIK